MRQPAWDVFETAILIDAFYKMLSKNATKKETIKSVSDLLRKRAITRGIKIDHTFRNENGIRLRLEELSYIDSNSSKGLRNTSKLFRDTMKMYRKDKEAFSLILKTAYEQVDYTDSSSAMKTQNSTDNTLHKKVETNDNQMQSLEYYLESLNQIIEWLKSKYTVKQSYDYLSDPSKSRNDMLYKVYYFDKDILWVYLIYSKRSRYISLETDPKYLSKISIEDTRCDKSLVRESRPCLKLFFTNFTEIEKSLALISDCIESYFEEAYETDDGSSSQVITIADNSANQNNIDPYFQEKVEKAVLTADLLGITPEELSNNIQGSSVLSIKRVRDLSKKIIDLNGLMVHVDALVDFEEASQKIYEIIEKLLNKNSGYSSSAQLFEYVRAELQMFLNDNDLCDEQKVFDLAKFLFSKTNWHGYHYEFSSGKHISRAGEKALKTNLDIFEKFARDMGGVFQWDDLIKYLEKVGIKTGNLRGQMRIGFEPIFFYVTSEELITVESMTIDEKWLNHAHRALDNLFNDVGDHIVIRNIAPFWYEQLPELPHRIQWTPLLLQYVLQFYGKQLGARTIHSELSTQYDSIHSLLVKDESDLHSFGDAVIAFVIDNGINERRYQAEEFRKILAYGKLIGNFENIRNMQRAIGNDTRFAWDATGEVLTLLI